MAQSTKANRRSIAEKAGLGGGRDEWEAPEAAEWAQTVEPPTVNTSKSGDVFFYWRTDVGEEIVLGIRGLRREKDELWGLAEVQYRHHEGQPVQYLIAEQRINFRSGSSKANMRLSLDRRIKNRNWAERIEWVSKHIQDQIRAKISPVKVSSIHEVGPTEFMCWPFLEKGEVCTIYGDGGSTKSLLTQLMALSVADGIPHIPGTKVPAPAEVLIIDYETNPHTAKRRLRMLADGHGISRDVLDRIHYIYVADPIHEVSAEIGRMIGEMNIGLVIVDSASAATQGGVSDEGETMRYFNSIRTWHTTVVTIAHLPKEAKKARGPAGVKQWENQSRNTFEVIIDDDDGTNVAHVAVVHRKTNNDRKVRPVGYEINFGKDSIQYTEESPGDTLHSSNSQNELTHPDRVVMHLEENPHSVAKDIAEELDLKVQRVNTVLARLVSANQVVRSDGRPATYALQGAMPEPAKTEMAEEILDF